MADTKGSALPVMNTPVDADIFIVVDDLGGTATTKQLTAASDYSAPGHGHAPDDGDPFSIIDGDDFICFLTRMNGGFSYFSVKALV